MPHDAKGRLLKESDIVLVPFKVTAVMTGEDYCNVNLESVIGMPPEGHKTNLGAINTRQCYRANADDDNSGTNWATSDPPTPPGGPPNP